MDPRPRLRVLSHYNHNSEVDLRRRVLTCATRPASTERSASCGALLSLGRFFLIQPPAFAFTKLHTRLTHSLRRACRRLRLSNRFGFISSSPEDHSPEPSLSYSRRGSAGCQPALTN